MFKSRLSEEIFICQKNWNVIRNYYILETLIEIWTLFKKILEQKIGNENKIESEVVL